MRLFTRISLLAGLTAGFGTGCAALLGLDEFREGGGTGGGGSVSSSASDSSSVASGAGGDIGSGGATASSSSSSATASSSGTGGMIDCNAGETIAALQAVPNGIAVAGMDVYWANTGDGTIMTWHEASIPMLWYTAAANGPMHISANAHQVCWTDSNNNRVECKSDAPNKMFPHTIVDIAATSSPSSIIVDDTYAYWTNSGVGEVRKQVVPVSNTSGNVSSVITASPGSNPDWIAVDATGTAFWVNYTDMTIMKRSPGDLVQGPPLVMNQIALNGLAVDADDVYWTSATAKTVFKAPKLTGTPITPVASNQLYPEQVTVDANDIYWWNQGDGTIMKAPKSGGAATVVICGQTDAHFAVSDTHVYWTDRKKGTVKRIPK